MSKAKQLFRQEVKFLAAAAKNHQLPKLCIPETAFIGKSNVGKSSLVNALCNRRDIARVSHTPGRTQQINFFSIIDKLILVDLPGYGFAKVPKNVKRDWGNLTLYYFQTRENLKLVNVLVDGRRGIKEHDIEMLDILREAERKFQIIFTKLDQINNPTELIGSSRAILASLGHDSCNILTSSSRTKDGMLELRASLSHLAL